MAADMNLSLCPLRFYACILRFRLQIDKLTAPCAAMQPDPRDESLYVACTLRNETVHLLSAGSLSFVCLYVRVRLII